jgi:hypothetical protein
MSEECEKIKQNRRDCDPFYKLLVDINGTFKDKPDVKFIDELLRTGIEIIHKKYGKAIQDNKHISIIFKLLVSDRFDGCDYMIKLFALLVMINHEPELANAIESFYDINGGLFKEKGPPMFRKTMILVKQNIKQTFEFPYNIANICDTLSNFILSVHMKYTCG